MVAWVHLVLLGDLLSECRCRIRVVTRLFLSHLSLSVALLLAFKSDIDCLGFYVGNLLSIGSLHIWEVHVSFRRLRDTEELPSALRITIQINLCPWVDIWSLRPFTNQFLLLVRSLLNVDCKVVLAFLQLHHGQVVGRVRTPEVDSRHFRKRPRSKGAARHIAKPLVGVIEISQFRLHLLDLRQSLMAQGLALRAESALEVSKVAIIDQDYPAASVRLHLAALATLLALLSPSSCRLVLKRPRIVLVQVHLHFRWDRRPILCMVLLLEVVSQILLLCRQFHRAATYLCITCSS